MAKDNNNVYTNRGTPSGGHVSSTEKSSSGSHQGGKSGVHHASGDGSGTGVSSTKHHNEQVGADGKTTYVDTKIVTHKETK